MSTKKIATQPKDELKDELRFDLSYVSLEDYLRLINTVNKQPAKQK